MAEWSLAIVIAVAIVVLIIRNAARPRPRRPIGAPISHVRRFPHRPTEGEQ